MFKRKKDQKEKKDKEIKEIKEIKEAKPKTTLKRRKKVKGVQSLAPKRKTPLNDLKIALNSPIPDYKPVLTSDITDITPDELIFAYSWANYPANPAKALKECGLLDNVTAATGIGSVKKKGEILKDLIESIPVQKAFREGLLNKIESLKSTNDKSRKYLSCIAYLDKIDAFDSSGKLLPIHQMPFHVRVCVQEYEEKEIRPVKGSPYTLRKIKFGDNKDALRLLMQETSKAGSEMLSSLGKGNTFIQNQNINTNIIGSGNTYNTLVQNKLDLSKLNTVEMDILFKALGIEADVGAIQLKKLVHDVQENIDSADSAEDQSND